MGQIAIEFSGLDLKERKKERKLQLLICRKWERGGGRKSARQREREAWSIHSIFTFKNKEVEERLERKFSFPNGSGSITLKSLKVGIAQPVRTTAYQLHCEVLQIGFIDREKLVNFPC